MYMYMYIYIYIYIYIYCFKVVIVYEKVNMRIKTSFYGDFSILFLFSSKFSPGFGHRLHQTIMLH